MDEQEREEYLKKLQELSNTLEQLAEALKRLHSERTRQGLPGKISFHQYIELSSLKEFAKFRTLPIITPEDIKNVDMNDLMMKLWWDMEGKQ